jgi:hypothetical protein
MRIVIIHVGEIKREIMKCFMDKHLKPLFLSKNYYFGIGWACSREGGIYVYFIKYGNIR